LVFSPDSLIFRESFWACLVKIICHITSLD
jgi:hypothetical protein